MIEIKLQQPLDLDLTLDSGQCFRWNKINEWWYGVVNGNVWKCKVDDGVLLADAFVGAQNFTPLQKDIVHYFNLDRDYPAIIESIRKDDSMKILTDSFNGMTILNQDPYETLLSYILSANNNVPAIKKLVSSVSTAYGGALDTDVGKFHTFPTLSELQNVSEQNFRDLKFGFRAKYFKSAIDSLSQIEDKEFWRKSSDDRTVLTNIYGVGDKIADCTRIYSLARDEVVPVDVWVRRILTSLYNLPEKMKYQDVQNFAIDYFGEYAGWAQLFLFVGGRNKMLDIKQ